MKWRVFGADATTGAEKAFDIEADDSAGAEAQARYYGLLVESVVPFGETSDVVAAQPAPLQYSAPAPVEHRSNLHAPPYKEIIAGAGVLTFFAGIITIFGWIVVGMSVVGAVLTIGMAKQPVPGEMVVTALAAGAVGLIYGVTMILVGVLIRMNASLAVAIRDIARNSFR